MGSNEHGDWTGTQQTGDWRERTNEPKSILVPNLILSELVLQLCEPEPAGGAVCTALHTRLQALHPAMTLDQMPALGKDIEHATAWQHL